ncbi:MAG: CDP-alcohol phosphatidyltransferase family protein [Aquificaceae bacterium]
MRSSLYRNLPNLISLSRLLFSPLMFLLSERLLPFFFLFLALTDALDGLLARRLRLKTELGKVLDPLADKVMMLCGLFLCVFKLNSLPPWLLYLTFMRDLFLMLGSLFLALKGIKIPEAKPLGKAFTFYLSAVVFLSMINTPPPWSLWPALLLLLLSWIDYATLGIKSLKSQTSSSF